MNQLSFPFQSQSIPVALAEVLTLLLITAMLGWWTGRWIIKKRIDAMRVLLEEKKYQLAEFRTSMNENTNQPITTSTLKTVYPTTSPDHAPDDLKRIDGIGPKIEELLNKEGIHTYEQLAETSVIRMSGILKKAGPRFQIQNPSTWPKQAELARAQKWEELAQYQDQLVLRDFQKAL